MSRQNSIALLAAFCFAICIGGIHFAVARYESAPLINLYLIAFAAFLVLYRSKLSWQKIFLLGLGVRILLLFGLPTLSDDFFRFIWDGRLLNAGVNPFGAVPAELIEGDQQLPGITLDLFKNLNSPEYFTIYPPISQFTFLIATYLTSTVTGAVLVIRLVILGAEVASFFLLRELLVQYQKEEAKLALYFLNPLVILELTGNLHLEAVMLTFILLAIWAYRKKSFLGTGTALAAAAATKLVPLAFLPVFLFRDKASSWLKIYLAFALVFILAFIPLVSSELINGLQSSLSLFIQKFEFNGSIYLLLRTVGFWFKGYNIIETLGPRLVMATVLLVISISFFAAKRLDLPTLLLFIYFSYLALAPVVHPWYCIPMLGISILTGFRFPLVWSFTIFLSYIGYTEGGYQNPYVWLVVEYIAVYGTMVFELKLKRNRS